MVVESLKRGREAHRRLPELPEKKNDKKNETKKKLRQKGLANNV